MIYCVYTYIYLLLKGFESLNGLGLWNVKEGKGVCEIQRERWLEKVEAIFLKRGSVVWCGKRYSKIDQH